MTNQITRNIFMLALAAGLVTVTAKADELDKLIEHKVQECEQLSQRAKQFERDTGTTNPQTGGRTREDMNRFEAIVSRLRDVRREGSPTTEFEKHAYAEKLSNLVAEGNMIARSVDRDLGRQPSGLIDHVVDGGALFTYGVRGAPYDTAGPHTFTFKDLVRGVRPQVVQEYTPINRRDAENTMRNYESVPGGVVLEGKAELGQIRNFHFDSAFNAMVLDDRVVYFFKTLPFETTLLARAIAADAKERVGVSIGQVFLSFGKLPLQYGVAQDLLLADAFLGAIVFPQKRGWTAGYKHKDGYVPQAPQPQDERGPVAVTFSFDRYQFKVDHAVVRLAQMGFDVKLLPLSKVPAANGGGQPDYDAITRGQKFPEYERNARYVASNIEYFRVGEPLIQTTFDLGETCAFLRGMKAAGIDLNQVARSMEASARP